MNTKKVTDGVMMGAIFTIMLFLFTLPLIGIVVTFLLPLPFILYRLRHALKETIGVIVVTAILSSFFFSVFYVPTVIMMGVVGTTIGELVATKKSRVELYLKTTVAYLLGLVFLLVIGNMLFKMNFIEEMQQLLSDTMIQTKELFAQMGQDVPKDQFTAMENMLKMIPSLVPILLTVTALFMSFLTILVTTPFLTRLGYKIEKWPPLHELSLPKQLIGLYLLVLLASFLPIKVGSLSYNIILNSLFLFQILAIFQGITFIASFFYKKEIKRGWLIGVIALLFFVPPLFSIVMLLGIIDLGFSLRKRLF